MRHKGPWSTDQIQDFLRDARIPVRIACNGASGFPMLASLWFVPEGGKLWCATQRGSSVAALLRRDPHCAFEVSVENPPYRGVRGSGIATLSDDRGEEILRVVIERYLGSADSTLAKFLLSRVAQETAVAIEPATLVSWDYQERMGAAG